MAVGTPELGDGTIESVPETPAPGAPAWFVTRGPRQIVRADLAEPPALSGSGASYIVGAGAIGAWAGRAGQIARDSGAWTFDVPVAGWKVYDQAGATTLLYRDGAWWADAALADVDVAQAAADAAQADADAAQIAADAAQATADAAQLDADSALGTADLALTSAGAAQGTADAAQVDATAALAAAGTAGNAAVAAQATADTALANAANAQTAADAAQGEVDALEGVVTALGNDVDIAEAALATAQSDIDALQVIAAHVFRPSAYFGRVTPGLGAGPFNSTSYASVIGGPIASFVDHIQNRISRVGSVFVFEDAGTYLVNVNMPFVAGSSGFISTRLLGDLSGVLAEHAVQVASVVAYYPAALEITVAAGEQVTLQYAVSSGSGIYTTAPTIGGEATSIGHIAIHRLY